MCELESWVGDPTVKVLDQRSCSDQLVKILNSKMDCEQVTEQNTNRLTYNHALPLM